MPCFRGSADYGVKLKRLNCFHRLERDLILIYANLGQLIFNFANVTFLKVNFIALVSKGNRLIRIVVVR